MSYTDKVANFLEAPTNELDTINFNDLELVAGDVLERVRSQPNSPLGGLFDFIAICVQYLHTILQHPGRRHRKEYIPV